jgi:hypothetical protein
VTQCAGCREIRCHVVRGIVCIGAGGGRVIEILRMAAKTSCRQRRVIATSVATHSRAGQGHVRALQRERGRAVIECRVRPLDRVMAKRAIHGEIRSYVIRYIAAGCNRRVVGIHMATRARGRHGRIVPGNVTLRIYAAQWRRRVRVG